MKTFLLSIILIILFSSSTCKKEGEDCHRKINIKNNSDSTIIQAFKIYDIYGKCILSGNKIKRDSSFIDNRSQCWEDELSNDRLYELYIIDPNNYNTQLIFYNCDSIAFKNTILKHYTLSLHELNQSNFVITYP